VRLVADPMAVVRAGLGLGYLAGAGALARRVAPDDDRALVTFTVRALGARHLGEAAALSTSGAPAIRRIVTGVDALHGSSMVALAVRGGWSRRLTLVASLEALVLAVATGLLRGRRSSR